MSDFYYKGLDEHKQSVLQVCRDTEKSCGTELSLYPFFGEDAAKAFSEFFNVDELILTEQADLSLYDALSDLLGEDPAVPVVCEIFDDYFGKTPDFIYYLDNREEITDELSGTDGLGPFFFVFDIIVARYDEDNIFMITGTFD